MALDISAGLLQGIQSPVQADVVGQFRQGQERRQGREFNKEAKAIWEGLPGAKIANLMGLDPSKATAFAEAIGIPLGQNERIKAAMGGTVMISQMFQANVDPLAIAGFANDQRDVMRLAGADTTLLDSMIEDLTSGDPERIQAQKEGNLALANSFKEMGTKRGKQISPASPKDFTVDSLAKYEQSGDISDLERFRPQIKKIAGVDHQYNPSTLMWEPLIDLGGADITRQSRLATELEAANQSALDFTKAQSEFQNSESKLLSAIGSGESKELILQGTAEEIRKLASGFSTQFGALLSDVPATEAKTMKGLINTIRANSAFTTLVDLKSSGGTLGAISEAELVLLESALGALDQAGTIEELNRVLDQILTANTSSLTRIKNAFQMDRKKFGSSFDEATTAPDNGDPNTLSDDDLFN